MFECFRITISKRIRIVKLLFIFSCLLNVILAVYLLSNNTDQHTHIIEAGKGTAKGMVQTARFSQSAPMTDANIESGSYQPLEVPKNDDLSQVGKYLHLKEQLLAIDIPESTVDIVLMSILSQDFSKKMQEMQNPADFLDKPPITYWFPRRIIPAVQFPNE